ncbi:MAG: hypothetical protein IT539_17570 [Bradyrhizobiaceae bacterium]|nr:hypothetical protein [Bradyrhizobiaceae bacterium]
MSIGATSRFGAGYTPGSFYKRHKNIGYAPGSLYKRFGNLGFTQARNMSAMNRAAAESVNAAFQNAGPQMFEAKAAESMGLSELAARQVLERVKAAMNALADQGQSLSLANGGSGGAVNKIA